MKRTIALILALVLGSSLAACGGSEEKAPSYQTVEITLDNWQQYLEIRIAPENRQWHTDAFDEVIQCDDYLCLTFREEYRDRVDPASIDIAVECAYIEDRFIAFSVDYENREIHYGDICVPEELRDSPRLSTLDRSVKNTMDGLYLNLYQLGYYKEWPDLEGAILGDTAYRIYPSYEMVRIQGTVNFQAE